jgi:hypothetical protein
VVPLELADIRLADGSGIPQSVRTRANKGRAMASGGRSPVWVGWHLGEMLPDTCLARPFFLNTFALEALRDHRNRWARVGVDCTNTNDGPQDDCLILQRADDSALEGSEARTILSGRAGKQPDPARFVVTRCGPGIRRREKLRYAGYGGSRE